MMDVPIPPDASGMIATDANGLCLLASGTLSATEGGIVHALAESAKRLDGACKSTRSPYIVIETSQQTFFIQQRADHTVVYSKAATDA
eukprot:GGOE01041770.1.p2 GENE.GGOE01041770.1~~GGOE01041770.1.p2  ORF type:complete len:102 (+),score=17.43 GGOE01041770.1:44-307(+)